MAAALPFGAFAALAHGRRTVSWICLALLPLAKEPLVLVAGGVVVSELVAGRVRRSLLFASALLPAIAWWTYLRIHLGAWFTTGDSALGPPFYGWWRSLLAAGHSRPGLLSHHGVAGVLVVAIGLALLTLLVAGGLRAVRVRGSLDLTYLALGAVGICLTGNATIAVDTALRNTAFLAALMPFVIRRTAAAITQPQPDGTRPASR